MSVPSVLEQLGSRRSLCAQAAARAHRLAYYIFRAAKRPGSIDSGLPVEKCSGHRQISFFFVHEPRLLFFKLRSDSLRLISVGYDIVAAGGESNK